MLLPSVPRVSGTDVEPIWRLYWYECGPLVSEGESARHKQSETWFLIVCYLFPCFGSQTFNFQRVWFPLTSFMGGRNSTTASLSRSLCFPLHSVGSSLTHLVEVGRDGVREATESHVWHQLFYLVSSPVCPWLCLLPNLSKQPFEIIRILQGLGEKGDKEKERFCFLISPPHSNEHRLPCLTGQSTGVTYVGYNQRIISSSYASAGWNG